MIDPSGLRRVASAHPFLADIVLATLVSGVSLMLLVFGWRPDGRQPTSADAVAAAVAFLLLLTRRRAPLPILALTLLSTIAFAVVTPNPPEVLEITAMVMLYTVTSTVHATPALAITGTTAAILYAVAALTLHSATRDGSLSMIAWTGMAAAAGGTVRSWRDYVAATEERAVRAEVTKEEEARRRVAEERLRIARELHDVIAHHIALINVQAGAASHVLRTRPEQADVALGHIREAGRAVLDELASLLHVLRQSGDATQPTEPVRGLAGLGQLVESLSAMGLRVQHQQAGILRPPPIAVDVAAYRIIQEGLTNAHKYGPGGAQLLVDYRPDVLHIQICNPVRPGPPHPSTGAGHGLTGMRERVQALGGSLRACAGSDGTFRLDARLPLTEHSTPRNVAG